MNDGYNGWKNRATWNIVLWINNDETMYRAACARISAFQPPLSVGDAKHIAHFAIGQMTPDGVKVDDPAICWAEVLDALNNVSAAPRIPKTGSGLLHKRHSRRKRHTMSETITITKRCVQTGKDYSVVVDADAYFRWVNGELAQRAFPNMPVGDREFLISGISPEGWEILFGDPKCNAE